MTNFKKKYFLKNFTKIALTTFMIVEVSPKNCLWSWTWPPLFILSFTKITSSQNTSLPSLWGLGCLSAKIPVLSVLSSPTTYIGRPKAPLLKKLGSQMLRNSLKWHFVDQSSKIKILEIACKTKRDDTKRTFDLQMKFLIIYIYASFEGISCSLMVKYDSKSTARSGANCIASTRNWKNRLRYSKYQTLRFLVV